jgi:hypothetical protein
MYMVYMVYNCVYYCMCIYMLLVGSTCAAPGLPCAPPEVGLIGVCHIEEVGLIGVCHIEEVGLIGVCHIQT